MTALFSRDDFSWLEGLRKIHYPPDRNQVPAHLTLFSQLPPSVGDELSRRLAALAPLPPPRARLTGILDLGGGTALRVESDDLDAIRAELGADLRGLLTPQDRGPWTPHVTIQNKVEPRDARQLQERLRAGFRARPLAIRGLASWRYLGGPWQPIRDYAFRG